MRFEGAAEEGGRGTICGCTDDWASSGRSLVRSVSWRSYSPWAVGGLWGDGSAGGAPPKYLSRHQVGLTALTADDRIPAGSQTRYGLKLRRTGSSGDHPNESEGSPICLSRAAQGALPIRGRHRSVGRLSASRRRALVTTRPQDGSVETLTRIKDWMFRDRATGKIVIAQFPNLPLLAWLVASVLTLATTGTLRTALGYLASVALLVWAADEIWRGVNPFRRMMGGLVLVWVLVSVVRGH